MPSFHSAVETVALQMHIKSECNSIVRNCSRKVCKLIELKHKEHLVHCALRTYIRI